MARGEKSGTLSAVLAVLASIPSPAQPYLAFAAVATGIYSAQSYSKAIKRELQKGSGHLLNTIDTKFRIPVVYGSCRMGGNIVFRQSEGEDNKNLYQVLAISEGKVSKISDIFFDGHFPRYILERYKSKHKWTFEVDKTVNRIRFTSYLKDKKKDGRKSDNISKYDGWDLDLGETQTHISTKGSNPTIQVTFYQDATTNIKYLDIEITAVGNPDATLDDVEILHFKDFRYSTYLSTAGIDEWFKTYLKDTSYEWIWYDGVDWHRYDTTTDSWIVDNSRATNSILASLEDLKFDAKVIPNRDGANRENIALVAIRMKYNPESFPSVPNITALMEGRIDANPFTDGTVGLIENPVWVLFDYMSNATYGLGLSKDLFEGYDQATGLFASGSTWKKAYDYCEQRGFKYNGFIGDKKAFDVIAEILLHFLGYLYAPDGKFKVYYEYFDTNAPADLVPYVESVYPVDINLDEDVIGEAQFKYGNIMEVPSLARIKFLDEKIYFQEATIELSVPNENNNEMNMEILGATADQAKWIGEVQFEKARSKQTITCTVSSSFNDTHIGTLVNVKSNELGINAVYRIIGQSIGINTVTLTLQYEQSSFYDKELQYEIYEFNDSSFDIEQMIPNEVQNFTSNVISEFGDDGSLHTTIKLNWDYPYSWVTQFVVWQSTDNVEWKVLGVTTETNYELRFVPKTSTIHFKIQPITKFGIKRPFDQLQTYDITVTTDTVAPATPTGLEATKLVGFSNATLQFTWDNNSEIDLAGYKLYASVSTETNFANATFIGFTYANHLSLVIPDNLPTALQSEANIKFWLTAVDTSGNESVPTTLTQDVTFTPTSDQITGATNPSGTATLTVTAFYDEWFLSWSGVSDDGSGYLVKVFSDSSGNTLVASFKISGTSYHYKEDTPDQRWFQVVALNSDGTEATTTASPIVAGGSLPKMVANQVIAQETVTWDLVEAGSKPPKVWTGATLPPVVDYPEGQLIYWTQDKKLYRNTGTVWEKKIPTADLDGTIGTNLIENNAITAEKILIKNWNNLIENPKMEFDTGWYGAGTYDTAVKKFGTRSRRIDADGTYNITYSNPIEVQEGEYYWFGVWVYMSTDFDTAGKGRAYLRYTSEDGTGATISGTTATYKPSTYAVGQWHFLTGAGVVPAGAKYIDLRLSVDNTATVGSAWFDGAIIRKGINESEEILAGLITSNHIATNTIVANNIASGAITADKISSNSIETGHIQAGAIVSDKIATNSILSKHLILADFSNLMQDKFWIDTRFQDTSKWSYSGVSFVNVAGTGVDATYALRPNTQYLHYPNTSASVKNYIDCDEGGLYYVSCYIRSIETDTTINTKNAQVGLRFRLPDDSGWNSAIKKAGTCTPAETTWKKIEGIIAVPSGYDKMAFAIYQAYGYYEITNVVIRRANDASLIVDGAITADKINVSELSAVSTTTGTLTISGASNGYIKTSSKTGFNDGSPGIWLDKDSNFELYNDTNDRGIIFDSANGNLTVKGEITVNSFNITDIDNISTGLRIPLVPANSRGISIDTQIDAEYGIYIKTSNPSGATAKGLYSISSNVAIEGVCPFYGGGSGSIAIKGTNPAGYAGWFESSDNVAIKLNAPKHLEVNVQTAKPTGTAPDGTIIFALDGANNVRMYIAYQGNWYESGINSVYSQ